ncbi:MAG: hypothetical protein IE917_08990 [Betaproteobacteria bacterium]|jgi:hypothetical protein|nr:hypothetical protein [Betaproteobacteria bacterium]
MAKSPRKLSLVKLKKKWAAEPTSKDLPFIDDMPLIFLGEIPNMPEHGVFAGHRSGRIYSGFHIFQFAELSENEV